MDLAARRSTRLTAKRSYAVYAVLDYPSPAKAARPPPPANQHQVTFVKSSQLKLGMFSQPMPVPIGECLR